MRWIGRLLTSPGIYQDNLWGLPVALSNTVGAGTALIGAFDSACASTTGAAFAGVPAGLGRRPRLVQAGGGAVASRSRP